VIEKGASKYEPVQQNMKDFLQLVIQSQGSELQAISTKATSVAKRYGVQEGQEKISCSGGCSMFGWASTKQSPIGGNYLKNPS
jgi:hypothetical protein